MDYITYYFAAIKENDDQKQLKEYLFIYFVCGSKGLNKSNLMKSSVAIAGT